MTSISLCVTDTPRREAAQIHGSFAVTSSNFVDRDFSALLPRH
jgi:hypothetical protein